MAGFLTPVDPNAVHFWFAQTNTLSAKQLDAVFMRPGFWQYPTTHDW